MSNAHFRFSTDILRRLGEELNQNLDTGIIELVKNSYDADAINCHIELYNTDSAGGSIVVRDDGVGMDEDDILNGWLVLGSSTKEKKSLTKLGRKPAGSKGLGRLAALRMGQVANLESFPLKLPKIGFQLDIDWKKYDDVNLVDDVALEIKKIKYKKNQTSGTQVRVDKLYNHINRNDVKRLARALILLSDPFDDNPQGFKPSLHTAEFSDLEQLVKSRYFDQADFHLKANLNKKGKASAEVLDWKGEQIYSATHNELSYNRKGELYQCPSVDFQIWVFILNKKNFSMRNITVREVREWLAEFGGVHIYQNSLRVSPFGNPGNDWLDMNLSRVRSPEERPGTNTSIGRMVIHDEEELLIQKTDRSGFIESLEFQEIKRFAQDALDWMAKKRLETAEARRAKIRAQSKKKVRKTRKDLDLLIDKSGEDEKEKLKTALEAHEISRDKEVRKLREEVQLYRTLSTAGITAATFAHESTGNPIKVINQSINTIERRSKSELSNKYDKLLMQPVDRVKKSIEALSVLGNTTLELLNHEKRRSGRVNIHPIIEHVIASLEPFLANRGVSIEKNFFDGNPYFMGSVAAVESIITNLVNNSLGAFEISKTIKRVIAIQTEVEDNIFILRFFDNASGIEGINVKDIWLPGETTKPNGTGLGLTIVKDATLDLDGEVDAIANGPLGGAEIIIKLPIIGV